MGKDPKPFPLDEETIKFPSFKAELSEIDIAKLTLRGTGIVVIPFGPIDSLSPIKMVGRGETNITLIWPSIVQTDANPPYARFEMAQTPQHGAVSMHFVPNAYGITSPATYIMEFNIHSYGGSTLTLLGYVGSGTLSNTGTKVINGPVTLQLVMHNVEPGQVTWGSIQQTAGAPWIWYSTGIRYPYIVINETALHP